MDYLLDSNIFIQAKNIQYPFDVFPGFWELLKKDMFSGLIHSIDPVYKELMKGDDELKVWISKYKDTDCFLKVEDTATQNAYKEIARWASSPKLNYTETAKSVFLSAADSWLIAKAVVNKCSIVTLEKYDPFIKKRIKIPNACMEFNVNCINTIDLLRDMKAKFILTS